MISFFADEEIQRRLHMNTRLRTGPLNHVWIQQKWESTCLTAIIRVPPEGINQVLHQWASGRHYIKISIPFKGDQLKERIFDGFDPEQSYGHHLIKRLVDGEQIGVYDNWVARTLDGVDLGGAAGDALLRLE